MARRFQLMICHPSPSQTLTTCLVPSVARSAPSTVSPGGVEHRQSGIVFRGMRRPDQCLGADVHLMVALLENSHTRSDRATQHKLNAVADELADLMAYLAPHDQDRRLENDLHELRLAVGLETRETTKHRD